MSSSTLIDCCDKPATVQSGQVDPSITTIEKIITPAATAPEDILEGPNDNFNDEIPVPSLVQRTQLALLEVINILERLGQRGEEEGDGGDIVDDEEFQVLITDPELVAAMEFAERLEAKLHDARADESDGLSAESEDTAVEREPSKQHEANDEKARAIIQQAWSEFVVNDTVFQQNSGIKDGQVKNGHLIDEAGDTFVIGELLNSQ